METKPWYLSKTFYSNLILMVFINFAPESLKTYFTVENVAVLFGAVNFVLRLISKDKITLWG